jgi:hypothetical protein
MTQPSSGACRENDDQICQNFAAADLLLLTVAE